MEFNTEYLKNKSIEIEQFLNLNRNKEDIDNFNILREFIVNEKFQNEIFTFFNIPYNSPKIVAGILNPLLERYGYLMESKQLKERLVKLF